MSTKREENGTGHSSEPDDYGPENLSDLPPRHLLAQTARLAGLTWNRLDAHVKDVAAWRRSHDEAVAQTNSGVLELVARAHRQDAEIERVRRSIPSARASTPESEFMTEAARQGLALAKLDREERINARKKRNAALIKVAVALGLALVAAVSSVVTYLLKH